MIDSSGVYPTWRSLAYPEMLRMEHLCVNLRSMNLVRDHRGPEKAYRWLFDSLRRILHHRPTFIGTPAIGHDLILEMATIIVSFGYDQHSILRQPKQSTDL